MLFGRPPFETKDVKVTYRKIRHNNYTFPSHIQVSESSKDLIKSLLKTEPSKRLSLDKIMGHDFFCYEYPTRLPASVLIAPPSAAFIEKYVKSSEDAPKPGVSPGKVPNAKDIATFEWDLIDNDEAQIMSNRQASLQTSRRMESKEKFAKFSRGKDAISNDRENFKSTDRLYFNQGLGKDIGSSPYCSPK